MKSIPAYLLHADDGRQVPFLVALLMFDQERQPMLPPAVLSAINRTVDITGRVGLVTCTVLDGESVNQLIGSSVSKALAIPDAILLYRCQSSETAENLMAHLLSGHRITLLKDSRRCS
ncbi:hypothetical protein ACOTHA_29220 [Achromobacter xylosoxidans]